MEMDLDGLIWGIIWLKLKLTGNFIILLTVQIPRLSYVAVYLIKIPIRLFLNLFAGFL